MGSPTGPTFSPTACQSLRGAARTNAWLKELLLNHIDEGDNFIRDETLRESEAKELTP